MLLWKGNKTRSRNGEVIPVCAFLPQTCPLDTGKYSLWPRWPPCSRKPPLQACTLVLPLHLLIWPQPSGRVNSMWFFRWDQTSLPSESLPWRLFLGYVLSFVYFHDSIYHTPHCSCYVCLSFSLCCCLVSNQPFSTVPGTKQTTINVRWCWATEQWRAPLRWQAKLILAGVLLTWPQEGWGSEEQWGHTREEPAQGRKAARGKVKGWIRPSDSPSWTLSLFHSDLLLDLN